VSLLVAISVNAEGYREILGIVEVALMLNAIRLNRAQQVAGIFGGQDGRRGT
jgi:hypothetical protein